MMLPTAAAICGRLKPSSASLSSNPHWRIAESAACSTPTLRQHRQKLLLPFDRRLGLGLQFLRPNGGDDEVFIGFAQPGDKFRRKLLGLAGIHAFRFLGQVPVDGEPIGKT